MQDKAASAASRYEALKTYREPFLKRGRQCAALTIPYLCPPEGFNIHSQLPTPFQSLGARGVRALASKLSISLYPPNTPFFKYAIDDLSLRLLEQTEAQGKALRGEIEKALSSRERAVITEMDSSVFRPIAFVGLQHLIVVGNALIYVPKKGRVRMYRLDQYVVNRSPDGTLLELVVKEPVARSALREKLLNNAPPPKPGEVSDDPHVDLYTHAVLRPDGRMWDVYQEIDGEKIEATAGSFPVTDFPWVPLRLSVQPGENYGRSYVEEYLGDLDSLEGLSETIVEGSAAVARVVFMVSPNGTTNLRLVSEAPNGATIPGDGADVTTLQAQKQADLGVARQQAQEIAQNLAFAFLLNTAIQRPGERVTAEEIRYMASELDAALGGVYTLLSAEFQLPVVHLFSKRMEDSRDIPALPGDMVKPIIVTGMEAIGRGQDQRNLKLFVQDIIQGLGPELAVRFLNPVEFIKRAAASYGIDTEGLVPDEQTIQQNDQQAMLMQLVEQLGPQGIQQLGGMGKEMMKQQALQQAIPEQGTPNG